jgi:iron complex outermembrane receptor protein
MNTPVCRLVVPAVALMVLGGPALAGAQDPYRQTVVVTAAATPVELGRVTRTIAVISRDEIAALPVYSVADVVRLLASVDVRARGERGVQSDFAMRGASFGQMLVLVDGVRLNDPQSGHHNGDIPVPLEDVERIEVLHGAGSSLFGADAFGGTVNVVTRRARDEPEAKGHFGSYGLAGGNVGVGFERGAVSETLAASFDRSGGFMEDRDFSTTMVRSGTAFGPTSGVSVSFLRKAFGANNFYGGNALSREWTNQTLVSGHHQLGELADWTFRATGSYRTHGDRFVFNELNPTLSDNRHRTHVALAGLTSSRRAGPGTITLGIDGGWDWIRSTNLGDHDQARVSAFSEWRQSFGDRTHVDAALRVDRYSEFGTSWSPSLGIGWWLTPAVRIRGSAGHAFRVPTFTERYYSDPANRARADTKPENSWSGEVGSDVTMPGGWVIQATLFGRADSDVIDWLRPTSADLWQTYNVRDVDTVGVELGVRRTFSSGAFLMAHYTALDVYAPSVDQQSKYALDYARQSVSAAGSLPLRGGFRVAPRVEYRQRYRLPAGEEYVLVDLRVARRFGSLVEIRFDATNIFDREYHEIAGVPMPGAAMTLSASIGR